jgi:hypothetical protein
MLKALIIIAGVVAVLVIGLLAYASTRPDSFGVPRSLAIKAAPERLFALINDMKAMNSWNPYVLREPSQKGTYSGPPSGKGAAYDFEGGKSGTGRIEIVDSAPPRRVTMRLAMIKPIRVDNTIDFTIEPAGDRTNVTWAMQGNVPLIAKVLHLFMNMDKMIGNDFEEGLATLKAMAEKS